MANPNPKKKSQHKQVSGFAKYSTLAIQMGVVIGVFAFLGDYIDNKYNFNTPIFTIVLSLFGVFGSMYILLKGIRNIND
jgi:heme/copper-type cytochrome/quinol oxidase subunit 4